MQGARRVDGGCGGAAAGPGCAGKWASVGIFIIDATADVYVGVGVARVLAIKARLFLFAVFFLHLLPATKRRRIDDLWNFFALLFFPILHWLPATKQRHIEPICGALVVIMSGRPAPLVMIGHPPLALVGGSSGNVSQQLSLARSALRCFGSMRCMEALHFALRLLRSPTGTADTCVRMLKMPVVQSGLQHQVLQRWHWSFNSVMNSSPLLPIFQGGRQHRRNDAHSTSLFE